MSNLDDLNNPAQVFDQLKTNLDQALQELKESDLDLKVRAYATALKLHNECKICLEDVKKDLSNNKGTLEWPGFVAAKKEIEELCALVEQKQSLAEKVSAHKKLCLMAQEYQRRLSETQNTIQMIEKPETKEIFANKPHSQNKNPPRLTEPIN